VSAAPRMLGALACQDCGKELATAPDRGDWRIAVNRGVLSTVRCPRCAEPEAVASSSRTTPLSATGSASALA
jgi:hypothetical protein